MHLLQRYALSCGAKIGKPFIITKFFPLSVEKFITLHPNSKYPAKCYDYWQDVVDILKPVLAGHGISIVQIGTKDDKTLKGVYTTHGQTSIAQAAYIVSQSLLHLGADSFATHIASGFDKKIVCLYSNNFASAVRPFWTGDPFCSLLEPNRNGNKPSFAAQETPKTINEIKPEDIANAVFRHLEISAKAPYDSLYFGKSYSNIIYETVPNQVLIAAQLGVDALVVRMDYKFDENILVEQLKRGPCCIVTNKLIKPEILKTYRQHIKEVIYLVDAGHSPFVAKQMQETGVPFFLATELSEEEINPLKIDYFDFGILNKKEAPKPEIVEKLKSLGRALSYSTGKFTLSEGKIYPSKAAWLTDKPISTFEDSVSTVIDTPEFWKELDSFKIVSTRN